MNDVSKQQPSLPEVHRTIAIPNGKGFWRKMLAYAGPGYLVAVGYMDPGNWATDLAGGAQFGYMLLSVILLSNRWRSCCRLFVSSWAWQRDEIWHKPVVTTTVRASAFSCGFCVRLRSPLVIQQS